MPTTIDIQQITEWTGRPLISESGDKIGKIDEIYLDEQTGQPEWLSVNTGLFGSNVSFVPLAEATPRDGEVVVPFGKDKVKDAPNATPDGRLSQQEEAELYRHYGMEYSELTSDSGLPEGRKRDASRDDAMTRSEEELRVGKTSHEAGRVRLRKWVDTEHVSTTVPVTREEVHIEREPITDKNIDAAMSGPDIAEREHEVVLNEERAVADTEVVPKERVRLEKDQMTEEEKVEADLRKEEIGLERDR